MTPSRERTILIVDDDNDTREALSEFLNLNGYAVACAVNGKDAIGQIAKQIPSLILLDLMMPIMGGKAFLAFARQTQGLENVPVIVTTAHPSQGAPGATAILVKPLRPDRLLHLIRSVLDDN